MSVGDLLRFSARGLSGHSLRTALSLLGVTVGVAAVVAVAGLADGPYRFAFRSNHLWLSSQGEGDVAISGKVELAEINGSETFVYVHHGKSAFVVQQEGVHPFAMGAPISVFLNPKHLFVYDSAGRLVAAPPAAGIAEQNDIEIKVYDEDEIVAEGFGGLRAVSLGATNQPRMVVLKYRPEGADKSLALVGKGIVFDSGGLSIKPASGMETMKTDMSGAAAVFGAVQAIAQLGIPVNVTGITPLTENMTGGAAQRPGDIFTARNGKTVEVLNTDAEGRLVLADGLSLAVEDEPDLVIDIATLTGACMVALGKKVAGLIGYDDAAVAQVEGAARRAGEKVWRLPFEKDYRSKLDSPIADIKNIGDRFGGAITAALFLAEFTAERPWAHLDIAGPARADRHPAGRALRAGQGAALHGPGLAGGDRAGRGADRALCGRGPAPFR